MLNMGKKKKNKKNRIIRGAIKKIFDAGIFLLIVLVMTYIVSNYCIQRYKVHNHSMEATLNNGDNVLIDKLSYRFKDPKRFDIIVFRQGGSKEELVKRIIGLPHEEVQIADGIIYIDGEAIRDIEGLEPPIDAGIASNTIKLENGEYFVIGDNRSNSIDSRSTEIGLVTSTRIIGKVFIRISPLKDLKLFINH